MKKRENYLLSGQGNLLNQLQISYSLSNISSLVIWKLLGLVILSLDIVLKY